MKIGIEQKILLVAIALCGVMLACVAFLPVSEAGVNYYISGYVNNVLGAPVPNARVEYITGNYTFTDASGYYNISVPPGTRDILNRAIGYFNSTDTIVVSGNIEHNVTLTEKEPVINNSIAFVGGVMGGLLSCALLFKIIRKRK